MAILFDKIDDVISCGTSDTMLKENVAFTVSFWCNVISGGGEASSVGYIIARDNTTTAGVVIGSELGNTGKVIIRMFIRGGTLLDVESSLDSFDINTWTHVVVTHDGSSTAANCHIYINGSETTYVTQSNGATPGDNSAQTTYIGNRSDAARTFDGRLCEMAVWSSALSSGNVTTLYGSGAPPRGLPRLVSPTTIQAYWPMDEKASGNTVTTVYDHSGNGNTGTASGSPVAYTNPLRSTYGSMIGAF